MNRKVRGMEGGTSSKGISLDEFIFGKLQPVRILLNYLNHEMTLNEGEQITLSRGDFDAVISTLEIFVEEYDKVSNFQSQRGKTR
ncbi:MAG: hypothetical protein KDB07_11370, partial [Planctomycetes bacterium]|nr:hypothetical protein [Planctomycetota bacterium]